MISIIIPNYNSEKTIYKCLQSIYNSNYKNFEVIVVDDKSKDDSIKIIKQFPCKLIKLKKNKGPAYARNFGANYAKRDILLFIDSDIVINKDSIKRIVDGFKSKQDIVTVYGYYNKIPANSGFFPEYAALFCFFKQKKYIEMSKKKIKFPHPFQASFGAIKKKVFFKLKGFDIKYRGADIEDDEFGYKTLKDYNIYLDSELKVKHHFKNFSIQIKNNIKRSNMLAKSMFKYKKNHHSFVNIQEILKLFLSFMSLFFFMISFFNFNLIFYAIIFLILFLILNLKFYELIYHEKKTIFLIKTIIFNYFMYSLISITTIYSLIKNIIWK